MRDGKVGIDLAGAYAEPRRELPPEPLGYVGRRPCPWGLGLRFALGLGLRALAPLADDAQVAELKGVAACAALDFAARSLGDAPRLQEHDGIDLNVVLLGHVAPNLLDRLVEVVALPVVSLECQHEALFAAGLDGEGRARPAAEAGTAPLGRGFDVLRVVVAPADDDEVFESARDEEVAVFKEAEVARA